MPLVNLSVKHNTTFDDAKTRLEGAVADVQSRFSGVVKSIIWSPDRTAVKLTGPGVIVDLSSVERQALARYTQDAGNNVSLSVRPAALLTVR